MKRLAIAAIAVLMLAGLAYADNACVNTCTWTQAVDYWIDAGTGVKIARANTPAPAASLADIGGSCCGVSVAGYLIEREVCQMTMVNGVPAIKKVLKSKFLASPVGAGDMVSIASGCHYMQLMPVKRCVKWDPIAACSIATWLWDDC